MTENPNRSCSRCGTSISTDAAGGLCPRCLMAMNFDSRTMPEGEEPPHAPILTPEQLAEKFPQFEILECLGRGGMGVVYKARQKSLDRMVAIKILPPERVGEAKFSDRFAVEAATLAKLNHPHIVTIHDFGETGGLFYLVMEFVDGVNLRDLLRDGKLEPKQALAIVPPICEALQFAHDKGIVHRDIKPENLLLDRDGRIKIADFGIASLVGANGEIAGTPPYMAPEQSGARNGIDHRADIYALGVVLYEMLTGERPGKDLVPPSKKVQIDVRLDEMVLRALEKSPELRYQTAGEFRTVVETMQSGPPAATPPAIPGPSATRGMFRRWWWLFLVMIPLGLALGLAAGAVLNYVIPKKYEAECTIEVKPPTGSQITPQFFGMQFEKLKSRETLAEVSKRLELENRWMLQEEGVIPILKGVINVQNIRGTDLINIRVRHTNARDAAGIANSLSLIYQETSPIKVLVHETAVVPNHPASPNLTLNLVLAALAGLLVSPLLALLAMVILHRLVPERRADVPVSGNFNTDSPLPGTTAFAGIAVALLLILTATNNAMVMMIGSGVALIVGLIWFAKGRSRLALLVSLASLGVAAVVALILNHRSSEARAITVDPSEMAITRVLADGNKVLIEGRALANARIGIHAGERGNGWSCAFPQDCRFTTTLEKTRNGLKCRVQPDTGEPILTLDGMKQTGEVKMADGKLVFRAGQPVRDQDGAWVADIGEWTSKGGVKVPIRVSLWLLKPAASEENRNAAPKSAAVDAEASAMAFGPVIERVLSGNDSLSNCYLDAETGHVLSAPRQFVEDLKAKGQLHQGNTQLMNLTDWARVNGADFVLQYQNPDTSLQLLEGFTIANTVPFESCEASKVVQYATEIQSTMAPRVQPGFHMSCQLGAPDVDSWIFRTREGGAGVLQLTAVKDNPHDVKIRYKLVQSPATIPPLPPGNENDRNAAPKSASPVVAESPSMAFGPVIERVVNNSDEISGFHGLDFESGRIWTASATELANDGLRKTWIMEHGIDLLAVGKGGSKWVLGTLQGKISSLPEAQWTAVSAVELRQALASAAMEEFEGMRYCQVRFDGKNPSTFALQTGGGLISLLQVTGITENPRGLKVRYKMVNTPPATAPPLPADHGNQPEAEAPSNPPVTPSAPSPAAGLKPIPPEALRAMEEYARFFESISRTDLGLSEVREKQKSLDRRWRELLKGTTAEPLVESMQGLEKALENAENAGNKVAAQLLSREAGAINNQLTDMLVDAGLKWPGLDGFSLRWEARNGDIDTLKLLPTKKWEPRVMKNALVSPADLGTVGWSKWTSNYKDLFLTLKDEATILNLQKEITARPRGRIVAIWRGKARVIFDAESLKANGLEIRMFLTDAEASELERELKQATPVYQTDKIAVEDLALHLIVAIREKDDAKLKSLATDRIKGWPEALPVFAVEMREHYRQMVGDEKFDMRVAESLVDGDLAAVKCTGPEKLKGVCLVLFFVKTADGWRNHSLRNAAGDTPLAKLLTDLKVAIQKEK